ncbi:MAG: MBL fold metallo-hydrolase [Lentisphaerae bacterium]|nr:MBL fold metallo-hydrolase [Lentisphaerota bacterium]
MHVIIGGCRGTHPVAQPGYMRYGGETTSYLVEGAAGERVIVDAGTGVRALGARLQKQHGPRRVHLLLTHYHLDHTMGLPALGLLYDRRWTVTMAAPSRGRHVVRDVMPRLLHAPFWPLQVEDMGAAVRYRNLPRTCGTHPLRIGALRVRWCPVQHPGGCTAYRLEEGPKAVVVATDVEWARSTPAAQGALAALCREPTPARVLIMDGQYSRGTYAAHAGWGHSTWEECVALARATGVRRLLITHHAPDQTDRALDRLARQVARAWPDATLARTGERVRVA